MLSNGDVRASSDQEGRARRTHSQQQFHCSPPSSPIMEQCPTLHKLNHHTRQGGAEEAAEEDTSLMVWFVRAVVDGLPRGRVLRFLAAQVMAYVVGCAIMLLGGSHSPEALHLHLHHLPHGGLSGGPSWVFSSAQLIFLATAACFVAVSMGDFYTLLGSSNPLKRQLLWVIFSINVQATCTYWMLCLDYFPVYEDSSGRPLYPLRYLMWACSTAGLIFLLDEVAQEPRRWLVGAAVGSDVVTISFGFISNCVATQTLRWTLFNAGCMAFLPTVWGMYTLFTTGARKLISRDSANYHRLLGRVTIVLWSAFPCVHVLSALNAISSETEVVAYAALDVATKAAYSMCILRSNCYSIDQLEEIKRIDSEEILSRASATSREIELASRLLFAAKSEVGSTKDLQKTFLAHMSHELRTPLNSMIGFNELLVEDNELSSAQRSYITSALNSAKGLLTMIDNILEYSKLENAPISLHESEFRIQDVIDAVIDGLRPIALRQGVDIICTSDMRRIPAAMVGDANCITKIITHFVGNAIKSYRGMMFTEAEAIIEIRVLPVTAPGKGRKRFKWRASEKEAEVTGDQDRVITLDIEVEDHGRGIPEGKLNKLFLPFGQVEPLEQRQGIGLGLAIVKLLARAMGGQETCTSIEGRGSVFAVRNLAFRVANTSDSLHSSMGEPVLIVAQGHLLQNLSYLVKSIGLHPEVVGASSDDALHRWHHDILDSGSTLYTTSFDSEIREKKAPDNQARGQLPGTSKANHDLLIIEAQYLPQVELERLPFRHIIVIAAPCPGTKLDSPRRTFGQVQVDEIIRPISRRVLSEVIPSKSSHQTLRSSRGHGTKTSPRRRSLSIDDVLHVLVVDDNKVNQKVIGAILRRLDVPYHIANDGIEAIERFCENSYDLILMDLTMPRMGGIDATRIIRRMEASSGSAPVDIVAMTAATSAEDEENCMQAGFTLYLPKPIKFSSVKELLDKKKADKMQPLAEKQVIK